jgi:predicted methyltransferase
MHPRLALLGALAHATIALATPAVAEAADAALSASVAGPDRSPADKARDVYRHPVQTLEFWGLRPGMTVVDLQPGGGYWTAILAPYALRTHGRYIAGGGLSGKAGFLSKFGDPVKYGRVSYVEFNKTSGPFVPAGSADMVISSREIHNWMRGGMLEKGMADSFAALKPGGVFAVEEHRADGAPASVRTDGSAGYVTTADVIAAAQKAGFRLAARSEINANPKDTKDHPFGVWTLPPTRQSSGAPDAAGKADPTFDHSKYDAIGESDRMTLRFIKPPS